MKLVFTDFVVDTQTLHDGSVVLKFLEAMEGEGPDGQVGPVGTGNEFHARVTNEVGRQLVIGLAIELGMMKDQDKPDIADLAAMREEVKKREKKT